MNGFIRAIWGDDERSVTKTRADVVRWKSWTDQPTGETYVWGRENFAFLRQQGIEGILVDERPQVFERCWRHKLEAWRLAAARYQEFIFLDFDIRLIEDLPADFWQRLRQRGMIQANLLQYKRRRRLNRPDSNRKVPSAAWVYFGDNSIPDKLIDLWTPTSWSAEVPLALYMDELTGGWKGPHEYASRFEPYCCLLRRRSAVPEDVIAAKVPLFHYTQFG